MNSPKPSEREAAKGKWVLKSKQNWVAIITALASLYEPARDWIADNPQAFMQILAGVFFVLRILTKEKVYIK